MAEIRVSPIFYSWIAEFGTRVRLLSPQSVVDGFRENCRAILDLYETPQV